MGQCQGILKRRSKKGRKHISVELFTRKHQPKPKCVEPEPLMPILDAESGLLREDDIRFLVKNSPFRNLAILDDEAPRWRRLYTTMTHGRSFEAFRSAILAEGPSLVVIETQEGYVFGGFTDTWMPVTDQFYGTPTSCAVFSLRPGKPAVYEPTYQNNNFQYCNLGFDKLGFFGGVAMGGQHGFYTWSVDQDLHGGQCCGSPSSTFGSPLLCGGKGDSARFRVRSLEVWSIGEAPETEAMMRLRAAKSENTVSILELYKEQFGNITGKAFFSDHIPAEVRARGWIGPSVTEPEEKPDEQKSAEPEKPKIEPEKAKVEPEKKTEVAPCKEEKAKSKSTRRRHHHHRHAAREAGCDAATQSKCKAKSKHVHSHSHAHSKDTTFETVSPLSPQMAF